MGRKGRKENVIEDWAENGRLIIQKTEEYYPFGTETLMDSGFLIILVNMMFGILPITIVGRNRVNYFRCSVTQLYTVAFGLCVLGLSSVFIPFSLSTFKGHEGTQRLIAMLTKSAHVLGFLFLIIRGRWVAKNLPPIWNKLGKLVQLSLLDSNGQKSTYVGQIRSCCRWSLFTYIFVMISYQMFILSMSITYFVEEFIKFSGAMSLMSNSFLRVLTLAGYAIWDFCNLSHILVSLMLSFLVQAILSCLKSLNEQLEEIFQERVLPKGNQWTSGGQIELRMTPHQQETLTRKFDKVRHCYALCHEVTGGISNVFGISIIVEVVILVVNTLVQLFYVFKNVLISEGDNAWQALISMPILDFFGLITQCFIHFYFFFKVSCLVTQMTEEGKAPILIINKCSFQNWPIQLQKKIQLLKTDIGMMTPITITASNYFQVNKFLITSVVGSVTTYIIVLLQFQQQENNMPAP